MNYCGAKSPAGCEGCYAVIETVVAQGIEHFQGQAERGKTIPQFSDEIQHTLVRESKMLLDYDFPAAAVDLTDELSCIDRRQRAQVIATERVMGHYALRDTAAELLTPVFIRPPESLASAV